MDDGGRWIFVGRARAQAHPQFKLSIGLVLSALYFTLLAGVGFSNAMQILSAHFTFWVFLLVPVVNLLTAVAIVMLWPFAHPLALFMIGLQIGVTFLFGRFEPEPYILFVITAGLAVGLYFFEGGRPNLIYRHRYYTRKPREGDDG